MTLGEKFNTYIEQHSRKQSEVAASWLEQWNGRGGKSWSTLTVASHLNRLLRNVPQGIRFFFQDRARGALLLEVLRIPEGAHAELFELADRAMKTEGAPARVVVDATAWKIGVERADALFAELKRVLITEGPYPIDLVILDDQYDRLPRSFDDYKDKVRHVRVKSAEEGWERTQELAEEQGLVLSSRRFPDFERWLAVDFDGRTLGFEPHDGLELFRTQGRLPALEPVTHDLSELVPEGTEQRPYQQYWGGELHRLMRALRSEEATTRLKMPAAARQGVAKALGINATSTRQERTDKAVQALVSELPVKLQRGSTADLEGHLARAQLRRVGPLALWVEDDTVHLLNVPEASRLAEGRPWLHVHTIAPQPTALERLMEVVANWAEPDFLRDPFLDQVLERLEPQEELRTALLHARAGLLLSQALRPKAAVPVPEWKSALEELLADEPPPALLRIHLGGEQIQYAGLERPPFGVTEARAKLVEKTSHRELHQLPPVGDLLLSREEELLVVGEGPFEMQEGSYYGRRSVTAPSILLPRIPDIARAPGHWLDLYEASKLGTHPQSDGSQLPYGLRSQLIEGKLRSWSTGTLELPMQLWDEADRELAMAWLALRQALVQPQTVRLHSGTVLLRLGGPFFAELSIYPLAHHTESKEVQGSLMLEAEFERLEADRSGTSRAVCKLSGLSDLIPTHTVKGGYDFGAQLPRRIHLLGQRYCADIRFRGSALFSESSQSLPYAAAVARIEDEKREAAAAAYDDDDD